MDEETPAGGLIASKCIATLTVLLVPALLGLPSPGVAAELEAALIEKQQDVISFTDFEDGLSQEIVVTRSGNTLTFTEGGPGQIVTFADSPCDLVNGKVVTCPVDSNDKLDVRLGLEDDSFELDVFGAAPVVTPAAIRGGAGDDELVGGDGDDDLLGDSGDDDLLGNDGTDDLFGGTGADSHRGGAGTDRVRYDDGHISVTVTVADGIANDGNATDQGEGGRDEVFSVEQLRATDGSDRITGHDGPMTIRGLGSNDILTGGSGIETLFGDDGSDRIDGGDGGDLLLGELGRDSLDGQDGDDELRGGSEDDIIAGGAGADTVNYSDQEFGVDVTIGNGLADDGSALDVENGRSDDVRDDVEAVRGTQTGDRLVAGSNSALLVGNDGADELIGGTSPDRLLAGAGDDLLLAAEGVADLQISCGDGTDTATADTVDPVESDCEDLTRVAQAPDPALPPAEQPVLCRGQVATIVGTQGADRLGGTAGRDVIAALGGNDGVKAGGGNDLVCGGAGNDLLEGGAGKDRLLGESGKDKLKGAGGKDLCDGGAGRDNASSTCEKERSA